MNEQLVEKFLSYLGTLENALQPAAEFVAEQAPLVVQEWLAWQFWSSLVTGLSLLVFCLLVIGLSVWLIRWMNKEKDRGEIFPLLLLLWAFAATCSIGSGVNLTQAAKVHVAPRVVVLEKVASLAKECKQ